MMNWEQVIKDKFYRNELILTFLIFIITLFSFTNFLNYIESRNGIQLSDPILHFFSAVNLTWFIFILIYFSLVLAIINLAIVPNLLLFTIQSYVLLLLIRMFLMFLLPLNPPAGMIALNDPFVQSFGTGRLLTKDLFFSGHTATLFLLYLTAQKKILKYFFMFATILVGIGVLVQHVHYSIDVVSAPFFAYFCYRIVYLLQTKKLKKSLLRMNQ